MTSYWCYVLCGFVVIHFQLFISTIFPWRDLIPPLFPCLINMTLSEDWRVNDMKWPLRICCHFRNHRSVFKFITSLYRSIHLSPSDHYYADGWRNKIMLIAFKYKCAESICQETIKPAGRFLLTLSREVENYRGKLTFLCKWIYWFQDLYPTAIDNNYYPTLFFANFPGQIIYWIISANRFVMPSNSLQSINCAVSLVSDSIPIHAIEPYHFDSTINGSHRIASLRIAFTQIMQIETFCKLGEKARETLNRVLTRQIKYSVQQINFNNLAI